MKLKRWMAMAFAIVLLLGTLPSAALAATLLGECRATGGDHRWSGWQVDRAATCTSGGREYRQCSACGASEYRDTGRTGHSYGSWRTTKEATCTRNGEQVRTCRVCGHEDTRKTDKAPHKYGEWTVVREATCTEKGEQTRECRVCGHVDTGSIKMVPHTWGEWEIIVAATDHSSGTRARTCQVCGTQETEDYDPEGTLRRRDKGDAVRALQEGLICYGAMKGRADGSFGNATERAVKAVQEAEGLEVDGVAWPQTQAYLGHIFGEWETVSELSDFSMGLKQRVCERCGYTESQEEWPEPVYKRGDRGDGVKALQEALNAAGYNCGRADGSFGGRTERAVSDFESDIGVEPDGIAWPGVISALNWGFKHIDKPLGGGDEDLPDAGGFGGSALVLEVEQVSPDLGTYEKTDEITFKWRVTNQSAEDCAFHYLAVCDGIHPGIIAYSKPFTLLANGENELSDVYTMKASQFADTNSKIWGFFFVAWGNVGGADIPSNEVPFLFPPAVGETTVQLLVDPPAKKAPGSYSVGEKLPFTLRLRNKGEDEMRQGRVEAYYLDGKVRDWEVEFKNGGKVSEPVEYEFVLDGTDLERGYLELVFYGEGIVKGKSVPAEPVKVRFELGEYAPGGSGEGDIELVVTPKTGETVFTVGDTVPFDLSVYSHLDEDLNDPMVFAYDGKGHSRENYTEGSLSARGSVDFKDKYTFTPEDADLGTVTLKWGAEAADGEGSPVIGNDVELTYTVLSNYKKNRLELSVTPDTDKIVFKEGESVWFHIEVMNNGTGDLFDQLIQPYDGQGKKITGYGAGKHPGGEKRTADQLYTFSEKDAQAGSITLRWECEAEDENGEPVTAEPVEIDYEVIPKYDWLPATMDTTPLDISVRIVGGDDQEFHVNDVITFEIEAKNTRNEALTNAAIMAYPVNMASGKDVATHLTIGAHKPYTGFYEHTVDTDDEASGYVNFRARIWDGIADGDGHYFYSNTAKANVKKPEAPKASLFLTVNQTSPVKPVCIPDDSGSIGAISYHCNVLNSGKDPVYLSGLQCHFLPDTSTDIAIETFEPNILLNPNEAHAFDITIPMSTANANPSKPDEIDIEFFAVGALSEGAAGSPSNAVGFAYRLGKETDVLSVTKAASAPANPHGFVEGEMIHYEITVANKTGETLKEIDVNDPLKGENEDSLVDIILEIAPHGSKTVSFDYEVTPDDVATGSVTNTASASWVDGEDRRELPSNTVTVDTWEPGDITVTKYHEPSTLPEGFAKGEMIDYVIKVTNNTDEPIKNIDVLDFLNDSTIGTPIGLINTLYPKQSMEFSYSHEVDGDDVTRTYVVNKASVLWTDDGGERSEQSNVDKADVLGNTEYSSDLMVFKGVEGHPATSAKNTDGEHYCVGEPVHYYVFVQNYGETPVYDVVAHDPLAPGGKTETLPVLQPEEEKKLYYDYIVTGPDGDRGWIENTACVTFRGEDGKEYVAGPDTIYVYTVPNEVPEGEEGGIEVTKIADYPLHEGLNGYALEDDVITYHVEVTNHSDHALADIEVWDPMYSDTVPLGKIASIEPEETVPMPDYTHTVDSDDVDHTKVLNMATARWTEDGKPYYANSPLVTVNVSKGAPRYMDAEVIKEVLSTPSVNPLGYVEGEKVRYRVTVVNKGTMDLTDIDIYDPLYSETVPIGHVPLLTAYQSDDTTIFEYAVTGPDVTDGTVVNQARAIIKNDKHPNGAPVYSNKVTVDTWGPGKPKGVSQVEVIKSVTNLPARGFFIESEVIDFAIEVKNNTDEDIYDVDIYDALSLKPGHIEDTFPVIPAKGAGKINLTHTVTGPETDVGKVSNIAIAKYRLADGTKKEKESNPVDAPTGKLKDDEPFGVITGAEVTKKETSAPANGKYYTRGETITYEIVVHNYGETMISEVIVYDTLKGGSGEIASIENFYPDSTRTYTFSYTVGKADVAAGKVVNRAYIDWEIENYPYREYSEYVVSPTGGEDARAEAKPGPQCCVRTLTGLGEGVREYALDYCPEHGAVEDAVAGLVAAAETEEQRLAAWEQAIGLWTEALNAEYDEIIMRAGAAEKPVIIQEKALFYAQLACRREGLEQAFEPAEAAMKLSEQLMNKTADLCYEAHTAPEARADRLAGSHAALEAVEPAGACEREVQATDAGADYREIVCEGHGTAEALTQSLAKDAGDAAAWENVGMLWLTELDALTNARYLAAEDDAARERIAAERVSFGRWLGAREDMLKLSYPGRSEITAEVIAQSIRARVIDLCAEDGME